MCTGNVPQTECSDTDSCTASCDKACAAKEGCLRQKCDSQVVALCYRRRIYVQRMYGRACVMTNGLTYYRSSLQLKLSGSVLKGSCNCCSNSIDSKWRPRYWCLKSIVPVALKLIYKRVRLMSIKMLLTCCPYLWEVL